MNRDEFIAKINTKQVEAFRSLFDVFYRYLVVFAMRYVHRQEIAEDIVQEVIIAIWENDKEYNSFHGFRSFIYDSVKNACLNQLKHQQVEQRYITHQKALSEEDMKEYNLMREEMYRELHLAISELPDKCLEIFKLHLQGKRNDEIAALLHLSVGTVKTQKKRAMAYLRDRLGKMYYLLLVFEII